MPDTTVALDPLKFRDPRVTAKGEERAQVALTGLRTLWFNTGSLCNITCLNCYMDSSPRNDALAYLTLGEFDAYLQEIRDDALETEEIAFTGGEPFMNPDMVPMIETACRRGFCVLVLTNAMKPLLNKRKALEPVLAAHPGQVTFRVSIDHYTQARHEEVRGVGTWAPMLEGLKWLGGQPCGLAVAGRTLWHEDEAESRGGYAGLFAAEGIPIDVSNPATLVLFPEMDAAADVPEITVHCWDILGIRPDNMMCATSRMVVKRRGADHPVVVPCTLLPYDPAFELGRTLAEGAKPVPLNHPHCARFCVLGGASCSPD